MSNVGKRFLTTKEAADYIGISPGTLNNWSYQRKGPRFFRCGSVPGRGKRLYSPDDLENFVRAHPVFTADQHD